MYAVQAMIHSLRDKDEATIISHKDNNNVIAEYKDQRYTAIYNVFNGLYYVDNIYGKIVNQPNESGAIPGEGI